MANAAEGKAGEGEAGVGATAGAEAEAAAVAGAGAGAGAAAEAEAEAEAEAVTAALRDGGAAVMTSAVCIAGGCLGGAAATGDLISFVRNGRAVQIDPMKPVLKAPGSMLLKPIHDEPLSTFAFKFNLCRYAMCCCSSAPASSSSHASWQGGAG